MIEDPDYQMPWPPPSWLQPVVPPPDSVGPLLGGVQPADEVPQGKADDAKDLAAIDANIGEDIKDAPAAEPAAGPVPVDPYAEPAAPQLDSTQAAIQPPQTPENNVWLGELAKAGLRPPPPPGPDAISGADAGQAPGALNPAQADEQQSIYLAQHPAELAKANVQADLEMRREYARQQQKLQDDDERQARADHTIYVAAREKSRQESAQLDADATRIANTKLTPDVGDTIGNMIAGALGGLASSTTGGRNLPLEQLNKRIELNWEAQKATREQQWRGIEQRRGTISSQAEQEAADYREKEAFRIGTYQRAMNALQTKMQDFDQRGTQVRALANQYAGIAGAAQQAKAKFDQTNFDNNLKYAKDVAQPYLTYKETVRKNAAEEAEKAREWAAKHAGVGGAVASQPLYGTVYKSLNDIPPKEAKFAFPLPSTNGVPGSGGFAVANNETIQQDATHTSEQHDAINYDLNELQKIALQRKGQRSLGAQALKRWEDTNEQHYDQLMTNVLNRYALILHGRSPTKGVLEEVIKSGNLGLKGALDSGDVNELINNFHDDIDNQTSIQLGNILGHPINVSSPRPHIEQPNVNTLSAPLLAAPVKGDAGYAHADVTDAAQRLDAILAEYKQNPGLGDEGELTKQFDDFATAQKKGVQAIESDVTKLEAKPKRTPLEDKQLTNNRQALRDRNEIIRNIEDVKKRYATELAAKRKRDAADVLTPEKAKEGQAVEHGRNI